LRLPKPKITDSVAAGFSLRKTPRNLRVAATLKSKIIGLVAAGFSLRGFLKIKKSKSHAT
jgi:hypothetical protein